MENSPYTITIFLPHLACLFTLNSLGSRDVSQDFQPDIWMLVRDNCCVVCGVLSLPCGFTPHTVGPNLLYQWFFLFSWVGSLCLWKSVDNFKILPCEPGIRKHKCLANYKGDAQMADPLSYWWVSDKTNVLFIINVGFKHKVCHCFMSIKNTIFRSTFFNQVDDKIFAEGLEKLQNRGRTIMWISKPWLQSLGSSASLKIKHSHLKR